MKTETRLSIDLQFTQFPISINSLSRVIGFPIAIIFAVGYSSTQIETSGPVYASAQKFFLPIHGIYWHLASV